MACTCNDLLVSMKEKVYIETSVVSYVTARSSREYLLTWNFAHIHNAQLELSIRRIIEQFGYQCPIFCSPDELIGD